MFGTIGHAKLSAAGQPGLETLMEEWMRDIRPTIPGEFVNFIGHRAGKPDEIVFIALAQDEPTYRQLAASSEQDAWYRKFLDHIQGDVTWEDVEMNQL